MAALLLLHQIIYAIAVCAAAGASAVLWQYRTRTGARALLLLMAGLVIWNGSVLVLLVTDNVTLASLSLRSTSVGIAMVSLTKLVFALEYTGRERLLRPRIVGPLAIPAAALVILAFTNPAGLLYATLEPAASGPFPITFEFGPAAPFYLVYVYALNVVVTAMIVGFIYRSRAVYRGQSLVLLGGSLAPWLAHAVSTVDALAIDPTPIGGILSGGLFAVAVVRYRLLDLMPIARERVIDTVTDGIFVVGDADHLVDCNPAGRRLLESIGVDTDSIIGRSFPSLFDGTALRDRYEAATTDGAETTAAVSIGDRQFQVTVTPIDDSRGRRVGRLLITRDITEQKRHEEQLERQNSRLEEFATLVSHDLRNPLNVADGYLELAFETTDNDDYLDEVERSHDRMESIIEDVLALAREGTAVTELTPVTLATLAQRAWDGVETGTVTIEIDADITVLADSERAARLFENLFRNSIDHGAASAGDASLEITVGTIADDSADAIEGFYVEDDGIGIPACRREQVLEDGYTTGDEGTGLGLSIVERIAEAHGWSVRVDESAAGGARFEFRGVETADSSASAPDAEPSSTRP